ncbi:MAG: hypothetical protein ACYDFU_02500 [Nitrospirota bacterium]
MGGLDLKLDGDDGIGGEDFGVSLDVKGKPSTDGRDNFGADGAFVEVSGKGDWDEPSYWKKVGRAVRSFFTGG